MPSPSQHHVLLLQGPSSRFFAALGAALRAQGAMVTRMGFCPGDRLYWSRGSGKYVAYTGSQKDWGAYCKAFCASQGITDLVMLGDGRYLHKEAIAATHDLPDAPQHWCVEQGYLRPSMLTVEPWGTGGRSRVMAQFSPDQQSDWEAPRYKGSFLEYAMLDTGYHVANLLAGWALYPRYRRHALDPQWREWLGWILKGLRAGRRRREATAMAERIAGMTQTFLFPLQLETDYQIRDHAPEGGVLGALEKTICTFAAHAPSDAQLVIKAHPMDNGVFPWATRTRMIAQDAQVTDRVHYIDGGDLDAMLEQATGCVTINSTVGLSAAQLGCPVATLGRAIYARPGITHQGDLASFFAAAKPPETQSVARFVSFLKATVLVPGAFDGEGTAPGARHVAQKILDGPCFTKEPNT